MGKNTEHKLFLMYNFYNHNINKLINQYLMGIIVYNHLFCFIEFNYAIMMNRAKRELKARYGCLRNFGLFFFNSLYAIIKTGCSSG